MMPSVLIEFDRGGGWEHRASGNLLGSVAEVTAQVVAKLPDYGATGRPVRAFVDGVLVGESRP